MAQDLDLDRLLAAFEAQRAAIDAAIEGIKILKGNADPSAPSAAMKRTDGPPTGGEVSAGLFHGLSIAQAAKKFLGMVKTKQSTGVICKAIREGGIETTAKNFYSNVYSILQRDKDFIKLGTSWGLSEWHPNRAASGQSKPKAKRRTKKAAGKKSTDSEAGSGPRLLTSGDERLIAAKGGTA